MTGPSLASQPNRAICVYCGASSGIDKAYSAAARTLGTQMAGAGYGLVYGGASVGLMGEVARAVLDAGGHVLGVIPGFLKAKEVYLKDVTELVVTNDMHERKMLMYQRSDAFVALPGGIGTLEELVEQMTWAQLGQHGKPIIIANIAGFWQPLLALLSHMEGQAFLNKAFIGRGSQPVFEVMTDAGQIVARIETLLAAAGPKGPDDQIPPRF